jgi:MFS family permease
MAHFTPIYGDEMTQFYFSFLYSFYSIPNIVLPLFGGVFCDRYGTIKNDFRL